MPYKDPETKRKYSRAYYLKNRERCNAATRRSYQKHKVERRRHDNARRRETRIEVLAYYGGDKLACVKCGFNDGRALSIDHIAGGGKQAERDRRGTALAPWLKYRGYPEGYQTLCMNCQFIKKIEEKEQLRK